MILPKLTFEEFQALPEAAKAEIKSMLAEVAPIWVPQPGPQTEALESKANILLYGGAAGGGKTHLLLGLCLTQHTRSIIFRNEVSQSSGLLEDCAAILGTQDGYSSQPPRWRLPGKRLMELGGLKNLGDETRYQGRAHDLVAFDELTQIRRAQFLYLLAWNRSTKPGQRCRVVCTANPPTGHDDEDSIWIIEFWAPWLDPRHPNPAKPGELRWFIIDGDRSIEVPEGTPESLSRTFIPSRYTDNAFLPASYRATLAGLPEPLRSQMMYGDFQACLADNPWQIIPTQWVDDAIKRWSPKTNPGQMVSMGVDPARGGADNTCICCRHAENWISPLSLYPGTDTPDSFRVGGIIANLLRDSAPIHLDVIGIGAAVYDSTKDTFQVEPINVANKTTERDKSNQLAFANVRALLWWRLREALDPSNNPTLALPPDDQLRAEIISPQWSYSGGTVKVESKDDIRKRLGRSTDRADALCLALIDTVPRAAVPSWAWQSQRRGGWMGG